MVETFHNGRDICPHVYLLISSGTELPKTKEDVASAKFVQITFREDYRIVIVSKSQKEFDEAGFQYIGNFPDLKPMLEYVIPHEVLHLYRASTLLSKLVEAACKSYAYFTLGINLEKEM